MTRDEVIKAAETCLASREKSTCRQCPYEGYKDDDYHVDGCMDEMAKGLLALLKQDSANLVDGIQAMRDICWAHVCGDCPAYRDKTPDSTWCGKQCVFFPDHTEMSPQEVAEIIWAYQAKKRKEEKADG